MPAKIKREWFLWDGPGIAEILDKPEGWGVSYFWYCAFCGDKYAFAVIENRLWHGVSGCCPSCKGNKWSIPGSLEGIATVGWNVPLPVAEWQLRYELAFLDHPEHPYNEKE